MKASASWESIYGDPKISGGARMHPFIADGLPGMKFIDPSSCRYIG